MQVVNLPEDLFAGQEPLDSEIILHHNTALSNRVREKSVLSRNAFSLVISGRKTMHFSEKTVYVQDSEIHLLSAGNCIASVTISSEKSFESVLIFFDNKILIDFYASHAGLIEKLASKRKAGWEPYVAFKKDAFIHHFIESLLLMLKSKGSLSGPMKKVKLQELLVYLLENHTDLFLSFRQPVQLSGQELRIRDVVEANRTNNLTIDELAFLCNMSPSTFKREFKKTYHSAPGAWLNEQKMILAKQLLEHRQEKPGEIWLKLGFETHTGFTRSFKKRFAKLPRDVASKLTLQE